MFTIENILNKSTNEEPKTVHSNVEKIPQTNKSTSAKRPRETNTEDIQGNVKKQKKNDKHDVIPSSPKELPITIREFIIDKLKEPHICYAETCTLKDFHKNIPESNEDINTKEIEENPQFDTRSNLKKRQREDSEISGTTSKKLKHTNDYEGTSCSPKVNPQQVNENNEAVMLNEMQETKEPHISMKRSREESEIYGKQKRPKQNEKDDGVIITDDDDPVSTTNDSQKNQCNSKIIIAMVDGRVAVPNIPTFLAEGEEKDMLQQHYIINNQQMIFKMAEPELFSLKYNDQVEKLHVSAHHKYPNIEMQFRKVQQLYQSNPRYDFENIRNMNISLPTTSHIDLQIRTSPTDPPVNKSSENIAVSGSSKSRAPLKSFDIESILNLPK